MTEFKINKKKEFTSIYNALFIVSTPIGNLQDITIRALETLKNIDLILCEDTRVTKKLLNAYSIATKCTQFDDHASSNKIEKVLSLIEEGKSIALVSDAGTPLLSDPGYKLVNAAIEKNIHVEAVPGTCSLINALVLSGFQSSNFLFLGFLPHEAIAKKKIFNSYKNQDKTTLIFFESPNRLRETIKIASTVFPTSRVCIAREMTKRFEEVTRGNFEQVMNHYTQKTEIKGEIVALIEITTYAKTIDEDKLEIILASLLAQKTSLKDAVAEVSSSYTLPKNQVYDLALKVKSSLDS